MLCAVPLLLRSLAWNFQPAIPVMLGSFGDGMVLQHDEPRLSGCGVPPMSKSCGYA